MRRTDEKAGATFKCPTCGSKVLVNTGYCLKCKKKVKNPNEKGKANKKESSYRDRWLSQHNIKEEKEYEILETIKVAQPDCDILLEKGDKIKIITEDRAQDIISNDYDDGDDGFYLANDGNWYCQTGWNTSDEGYFQQVYGPFNSLNQAQDAMRNKHLISKSIDPSGMRPKPKRIERY